MDEIKNIYVALSRLYNISAERVITTDDIDEVCNSFEIFAFKDEVTTIAEKVDDCRSYRSSELWIQ